MYIGMNLGTSGVKVILLNEQGEVVASQTEKLTVSRPHPLWSEQDPEQWWQVTDRAMRTWVSSILCETLKHWVLPGKCTVQLYLMLNSGCYVLPFCGTTGAVQRSAFCWNREFRNRGRLPATL